MVRANLTKVTVYENQIDAAFTYAGGSVYRQMMDLGFKHIGFAQERAPVRTGNMRGMITRNVTPSGRYEFKYTVSSLADYSIYTLYTTVGPIFPNKTIWLWVRPAPYSRYHQFTPRMFVDGYVSRDWMMDACEDALHAAGVS